MTSQEYIQQKLDKLKTQENTSIENNEEISDFIFKTIMSKKFRKYSAKPELVESIKNAIQINTEKKQPINLTFLHGAYKLWRLEESPEADWAELFASMYYTRWLKPICEIYKPGVWFDYFVDDLIVNKLDNIPFSEIESYVKSFQTVLDFLKLYQPKNMKMTITRVGDQFESPKAFYALLEENIKKVESTNPVFTQRQLEMVELNAKPTPEQLKDPQWREKIHIVHDAYIPTKTSPRYHYRPDKILVFNQPLPSGTVIAVGTTKTSIAKFWVGVGALKRFDDSYIEYIFSPKQLKEHTFTKEHVHIDGLDSKNFKNIRVFEN